FGWRRLCRCGRLGRRRLPRNPRHPPSGKPEAPRLCEEFPRLAASGPRGCLIPFILGLGLAHLCFAGGGRLCDLPLGVCHLALGVAHGGRPRSSAGSTCPVGACPGGGRGPKFVRHQIQRCRRFRTAAGLSSSFFVATAAFGSSVFTAA